MYRYFEAAVGYFTLTFLFSCGIILSFMW